MSPWPKTLRGRIVALTCLGVLLPMALLGGWLASSARKSGQEAVLLRLESSLASTSQEVAYRWIPYRSALHELADDPRVRAMALGGTPAPIPPEDPVWSGLEGLIASATVTALSGGHQERLAVRPEGIDSGPVEATLPASLPIHEDALGPRIGTLDVRLRLGRLLPPGLSSVGVGGGTIALFDGEDTPLLPSPMDRELLESPRFSWNGEDWVRVERRLQEPPLRIAMAAPLGPVTEPFTRAARRGLVALLAVTMVAMLAATLLSGRLTRSLESLASVSEAVSLGRLDAHVPVTGTEEVRSLSRSFNAMTESLRGLVRTVAQQRSAAAVGEFASSLAHEVRNPLTAVRLDLEEARDGLGNDSRAALLDHALAQIDRLDATLRGTLRLAASGSVELLPIDLNEPVRAAARAGRPLAEEASASLEVSLRGEPVPVRGNPTAIEQLVLNLILNAVEAAGADGHVRVSVESEGGTARVVVRDDGPGVSAQELGRIGEPFFTTKAGGTGLGLAVARRIADAHGGELRLECPEIGGLCATFSILTAQP